MNAYTGIARLLLSGESWSGNERNCCFLNTGDSKFANISAATGLDFIEDGRAIAVADWDYDGDLDYWLSNRNAPRIRFVRNDLSVGHHFLNIRLRGTPCNRDAVGARVELHFANSKPGQIIKSLRAGEGFLSQSSKWLHFGLGTRNQIERMIVHWPGGEVEEFTNLAADRWYELSQGGKPQPWTPPVSTSRLKPSEMKIPRSSEQTRLIVLNRMQGPDAEFQTFDEKTASLEKYEGKPLLINLWASWCAPCLAELTEFGEHAEAFKKSGLKILALNVNGLADDNPRDVAAVRMAFEKLSLPFDGGLATPRLVSMLERGPGMFLNRNASLPIPSSFLFDSQGKIAIIYTGPVNASQLQADLSLLNASNKELLAATTPFPGHWLDELSADQTVGSRAPPGRKAANGTYPLLYGVLAVLMALGLSLILYFRSRQIRSNG